MNKIIDQADYQPNVPYQPLNQQHIVNNTYTSKSDELEQLLKGINIPDQVEFEHEYNFDDTRCCFCGSIKAQSKFHIQGIGILEYLFEYNLFCSCSCLCYCECCKIRDCDAHKYPQQVYILKNDLIRLEYWPGDQGKIYVNGKQVLSFLQTIPNECDSHYQSCLSSFPKLQIHSPIDKNYQITLRPDVNNCPESWLGGLLCIGCLDVFSTSKNYNVDGLTQGRCQIINTRTPCESCAKVTETQGCFCKICPFIDYPRFAVQFEGVRKIDKLAIILGLVHTSFYTQWINFDNKMYLFNERRTEVIIMD